MLTLHPGHAIFAPGAVTYYDVGFALRLQLTW